MNEFNEESRSDLKCSVVVPVFNDWHRVPVLLSDLEKQTMSRDRFEVILVDNGSDEVPRESTLPDFVRMVRCSTPGSYAARNAGIGYARASLIAFTDADCRPVPEWLTAGADAAERSEGMQIVAGSVRMEAHSDEPGPYERYDLVMGLPQSAYVRRGFGVTANLFVPAGLFTAVGRFDEKRFSGGDAEFCRRAGRAGYGITYCAEALVRHPARRELAELLAKVRRVKGGQVTAGPLSRRLVYTVRTFLPPVRAWWKIFRSTHLASRHRVIIAVVQGRLWLAEMAELFRLAAGSRSRRA